MEFKSLPTFLVLLLLASFANARDLSNGIIKIGDDTNDNTQGDEVVVHRRKVRRRRLGKYPPPNSLY